MTTPVTHSLEENTAREPLPPVERNAAQNNITPSYETKPDPNSPPGAFAKSVAHWVHKHPEAHKHGAGVVIYQFARSALASVPYGIMMALTLAGFTKMERSGQHLAENAGSEFGKRFGRGLNAFAKFGPGQTAALVAASFTFYRGTSKLGKWMTEYLFNPKDSEARTAEKVDDLPQEAWRKIKEIAPAEVSSTPVAAVVLGFIVKAFSPPFDAAKRLMVHKETGALMEEGAKDLTKFKDIAWTRDNFKATEGLMPKLKLLGSSIVNRNAKFIPQAAINSFGYALFFELGDRLFKDTQIRRGVWPGEHNSIKALKAAPDEYEKGIKQGNEDAAKPKYEDSAAEAVQEKKHYGFFTSEPGLGRFVFRRLLPTAVGITAYTAAKMRWATMLGNDFAYKATETALLPKIPKLAWGEGAATSLFFLIPIVSEPWEKMYDNFWAKKEKIAQAKDHAFDIKSKELTPHQEQKYDELLGRVNAKERAAANEASFQQRA